MVETSNPVPGIRPPGLTEKIRILLGCLRHPLHTWRWWQFLRTHPLPAGSIEAPARFLAKLHHPYLSTRLDCAGRATLLRRHYESVFDAGFVPLIKQAARAPLRLALFAGKSGALYELLLSALEEQRQDGELVLRLISRGVCIYTAAFAVGIADGQSEILLGGLNGMLATDRNIGIKQVTRDLYGCRPKDLMVTLVRDIGARLGCDKTVLIGNRNKIPDHSHRICRKSSDYDQTWQEMQARPRDDGNFELPCSVADEPAAMRVVHSNRRNLLVDSIRSMVRAQVEARRSPARYVFAIPLMPATLQEPLLSDPGTDESYSGLKQSKL